MVKRKNIKVAIVTSKDFIRTIELLEYFNLNVDLVVTPEITSRGKPYPDPLFYAAKTSYKNFRSNFYWGHDF